MERIVVVAKYDFYFKDVLELFKGTNYEVHTFRSLDGLYPRMLKQINPIFIFFPHYSRIIPKEIYSNYSCIGFHVGNLPKDRGGSPIQNLILKKKYKAKLSAIEIEEEIDSGAIYTQEQIDLTTGNLEEIIKGLSKIISRQIYYIVNNRPIPISQNGEPEFFRRLKAHDSQLRFADVDNTDIFDLIRMRDGLDYPPAYIEIDKYRIQFRNAILAGKSVLADCEFIRIDSLNEN